MAQININIRMDEGLKKQAESLFSELGMTISTAFNVFVRQAVRQRKIPFEISAESDPFYSESNMKVLLQSIKEADEGKFIVKTMEELEAMEK
ncbi:type II toxin-antitoxin system RelB/DinJ family antitoxin [Treponema primitia]|uniref:type II toxin-antitoxin system RelB/DinJ family antitoxin n=1 Tax=Treponema primitia TaxID=88058 RepID=UPI000474AFF0|nr:type II toxin-antitoxin system RelB/DinJ family antitoxin [Treponema primitia]